MFPRSVEEGVWIEKSLSENRDRHHFTELIIYWLSCWSIFFQNAKFQTLEVRSKWKLCHKQQAGQRLLEGRNSDLCLSRCFVFVVEKFRGAPPKSLSLQDDLLAGQYLHEVGQHWALSLRLGQIGGKHLAYFFYWWHLEKKFSTKCQIADYVRDRFKSCVSS